MQTAKTETKRVYKGSDIAMLTSIDTILGHALDHQEALKVKRSLWGGPYFNDLKDKVSLVMDTHFGKDAAKHMREATQVLKGMQDVVLSGLSDFKVQVDSDFESNKSLRNEIMTQLGFNALYKDVVKKNQEALVELLYQFKKNMSPELKAQIVAKGTDASLIEGIVAKAEDLKKANITQETLKGGRKTITQETIGEFNTIYKEVIAICKMATTFFKDDAAVRDKFNFAKTMGALSGAASASTLAKAKKAKALQSA